MSNLFKRYLVCITIIFVLILSACSKDASKNNDSIKLQFENEHFEFYSFDKDKECIEDLVKALEENYDIITNNLGVSLKNKTKVSIYPNIQAFHNIIGMPYAPDWLVGSAWRDEIYIVSPLNPGSQHNYKSLIKAVVHEFVHVVQFNINSNYYANRWMSDGMATYESNQVPNRTIMKSTIDGGKIPSLSYMNSKDFAEVGGYDFSYTVAEYLVKEYGYETIVDMIEAPENMCEILGKSLDEFENDWINYLKENWGSQYN